MTNVSPWRLPWKAGQEDLTATNNGWERFNYFLFLLDCVFRASGISSGVDLFHREGSRKGNSGRIENLTLEVALVEIHPFGASFVHVYDFGMIEPE